MKSVVNSKSSSPETVYPYLGKSSDSERVVLFTAPKKGFIVNSDDGDDPIGYYWGNWQEEYFSVLNGSVTLSNE